MHEQLEVPEDFVPAIEQAHDQGLLMIDEAAKLLDMLIPELAMEAGAGHIQIAARFNNLPCFSLQAIDLYRRNRRTEAQAS